MYWGTLVSDDDFGKINHILGINRFDQGILLCGVDFGKITIYYYYYIAFTVFICFTGFKCYTGFIGLTGFIDFSGFIGFYRF